MTAVNDNSCSLYYSVACTTVQCSLLLLLQPLCQVQPGQPSLHTTGQAGPHSGPACLHFLLDLHLRVIQVPEEILSLCEEYIPGNPAEFFFDRNPENFPSILEMYRSDKHH